MQHQITTTHRLLIVKGRLKTIFNSLKRKIWICSLRHHLICWDLCKSHRFPGFQRIQKARVKDFLELIWPTIKFRTIALSPLLNSHSGMISKKNRSRLIPILNLQARIKNKSKKKRRISMTVLLKKIWLNTMKTETEYLIWVHTIGQFFCISSLI